MTVLTIAGLTLRECLRRKVIWALLVLTVLLLALDGWGFASLPGMDSSLGSMTSVEARLVASQLLNLVMFALSLIGALGTAFLAGPTLSGELESGVALAMLARPVNRASLLLGKWLGLSVFACGYMVLAGLAQFTVTWATVGFLPPNPVAALAMMPTDGLWRGAMYGLQEPWVMAQFPEMAQGYPFSSPAFPSTGYLLWALVWTAMVGGVCALSFTRRDV